MIQCNSIMVKFMREDWILFSMSKCRVIFGGGGGGGRALFLSCMVCIHAKLLFLLSTSKKKRLT